MSLFNPSRAAARYLRKNPDVKVIVVAGHHGRKSAIRSLAMILGETLNVSIGVNKNIRPDVVILDHESATDLPGIKPDVVVITSIVTDAEARDYFEHANNAGYVVLNYSETPQEYAKYLMNPNILTYGDTMPADYYFESTSEKIDGFEGSIVTIDREHVPAKLKIIGEHSIRHAIMAVAVAKLFGIERKHIIAALKEIRPIHGRMAPAKGLGGTYIIDDSANVSVFSMARALRTIYDLDAPSRIVVTDDFEKLGKYDKSLISEVLVLGENKSGKTQKGVSYFDSEVELVNYLGTRYEENGIILLEIPLTSIIQSYIW